MNFEILYKNLLSWFLAVNIVDLVLTSIFYHAEINPNVLVIGLKGFITLKIIIIFILTIETRRVYSKC